MKLPEGITPQWINQRKDCLVKILKKEGTYKQYVKHIKKGQQDKALEMTVDIIERYGQDLR